MTEVSSRRAQTRLALIEAATRVFAAKGVDASVEELCDAAGYTRGAFYSNFNSKTELCAAVIDHYMHVDLEAAAKAIPAALLTSLSADDLIKTAIDNFIALWGANVNVLLALHFIRLASAGDPELRAAVHGVEAELPGLLNSLLEETFAAKGLESVLPVETLMMVLRSVYLGSLLDDYIAGNVDFELLRFRLTTVLKALVTSPVEPG